MSWLQIIKDISECSNCGECCSNILLISDKEQKAIKKYIREHNIKPLNKQSLLAGYIDVCPFRDKEQKNCIIYSVRPEICRKFNCFNSVKENLNYKELQAVNMLKTFFPTEFCEDTSEMQLELNKKINKFNKLHIQK